MAEDNVFTEYHLTPPGWVKGTERYFRDVAGGEVERPQDAVETWERHIYQRSMWSQEQYRVRIVWHDESVGEPNRKELRSRFGMPKGEYNENVWLTAFRNGAGSS